MFEDVATLFNQEVFSSAIGIFFSAWPVWVPLILLHLAWSAWLNYIRRLWVSKQGSILLEIRLPKEVTKSPAAMELVLQGIWENANIATPADAFWEGKMREWFSLEIVSIGGEVRFFVWAFPRWKKIIESRIYAQYPEAEVFEVKDYALDLRYDPEKVSVFGVNTALTKPDAYPIKTYIEYELDKKAGDQEEQAKIVDPITPVIEYLGTLKPGEVAGIQILIRAHAKESYLYGRLIAKPDWRAGIKKEIEKMVEEESLLKPKEGEVQTFRFLNLTKAQTDAVASIQRNAAKLAFDTMIRLMYMAPKDEFEKTRGMGMIGSMRQFGSATMLNGIKPTFPLAITYPWQDFKNIIKTSRVSQFVDAYKRRAYFGPLHYHLFGNPYILTVEEVATLFHLPGSVATTPSLVRAPSKKAEAPANLPV